MLDSKQHDRWPLSRLSLSRPLSHTDPCIHTRNKWTFQTSVFVPSQTLTSVSHSLISVRLPRNETVKLAPRLLLKHGRGEYTQKGANWVNQWERWVTHELRTSYDDSAARPSSQSFSARDAIFTQNALWILIHPGQVLEDGTFTRLIPEVQLNRTAVSRRSLARLSLLRVWMEYGGCDQKIAEVVA